MKIINIEHLKKVILAKSNKLVPNKKQKIYDIFINFFRKYKHITFYKRKKHIYIKHSDAMEIINAANKITKFNKYNMLNNIASILADEQTSVILSYLEAEQLFDVYQQSNINNLEYDKKLFLKSLKDASIRVRNGGSIGFFDLEFWEHDHYKVLEIGWVIKTSKNITKKHIIISDYEHLINKDFVQSNKFSRSDSIICSLEEGLGLFKSQFLNKIDKLGGHGLDNDIKILKHYNIDIKPDLDTGLYGYFIYNKRHKISIKNLLSKLKIEHNNNLHNATDDAEMTLQIYDKLVELKG